MTFKVGEVVTLYTDRSKDEKTKHIIIVAESRSSDNCLGVFINSNQSKDSFIKEYQPAFNVNEERRYLDHQSYIDCYSPIEFTEYELKKAKKRGDVTEDDLALLRGLIRDNPQLTNGFKKSFRL